MAFTGRQPGRSVGVERLIHARDIALAGDVYGSTSFDATANVSIDVTIQDDSHNHIIDNVDGLQTALDTKAPIANLTTHTSNTSNPHIVTKTQVGLGSVDNTADSAKNVLSATKLTTARTIALSGDVTGSVSFDGSANTTINTTVADDSHNHIISNVDGLQTALDSKANTVTTVLKSSSTGAAYLPVGTSTERPANGIVGMIRCNNETGSLEFYDGSIWVNTNLVPTVNSVTGTIYAGAASNLTINVTKGTYIVTVRFSEGGSTIADVDGVVLTSGSSTVAVPAAVYGQTAGDTIAVSVINSDGTSSSNAISKTVVGLPAGGTITTSGGYRIHTFTSSSSFVVPSGLTLSNVEYLVIGGGGAGGGAVSVYEPGGGGGAGGYRCSVTGETSGGNASSEAKLSLNDGSYVVIVGAGGAGVLYDVGTPGSGGITSFSSVTSIGGGAGGDYNETGKNGGSGGGEAETQGVGFGTYGQGSNGGRGFYGAGGDSIASGGGGGGSLSQGSNGTTSTGGNGGSATSSNITGVSVARAGGGGGGGITPGYGGGGGAGNAVFQGNGLNASPNTGSGGGGSQAASSGNYVGGNGGSGIVIIRYQL